MLGTGRAISSALPTGVTPIRRAPRFGGGCPAAREGQNCTPIDVARRTASSLSVVPVFR